MISDEIRKKIELIIVGPQLLDLLKIARKIDDEWWDGIRQHIDSDMTELMDDLFLSIKNIDDLFELRERSELK